MRNQIQKKTKNHSYKEIVSFKQKVHDSKEKKRDTYYVTPRYLSREEKRKKFLRWKVINLFSVFGVKDINYDLVYLFEIEEEEILRSGS